MINKGLFVARSENTRIVSISFVKLIFTLGHIKVSHKIYTYHQLLV